MTDNPVDRYLAGGFLSFGRKPSQRQLWFQYGRWGVFIPCQLRQKGQKSLQLILANDHICWAECRVAAQQSRLAGPMRINPQRCLAP